MKKTTKKNIARWLENKSPLPNPAHRRERLVTALEGLIREYRSGSGDVLSRMTAWLDDNGAPRSFENAMTIILLGEGALPETGFDGGSILIRSKREYAALAAIGEGSAERGAGHVVDAALRWLNDDRDRMVAWLTVAVPRLRALGFIGGEAQMGLLRVRLWTLPVQHPTWWGEIQEGLEPAFHAAADPEGVIRAMALAWNRKDFPGRAFAPLYPRHFAAA